MNAQQNAAPMTKSQEQAVVQGAMQQAILRANEASSTKGTATILPANTAAVNHNIPMVIPRIDLLLNRVVFLANTLDRDAETIQYMDLKKGKKETASLAYYKSTTPVKESSDAIKMVNEFAKTTGAKELVMRERLVKASAPERKEDGSVSANDLTEWKQKLIAALTKTILEI